VIATRATQTAQASGVAAGLIWATGNYSIGSLGVGDVAPPDTTRLVQTLPVIDRPTAVAASGHSLALDAHGSVWAWGWNNHGALGLGPGTVGHTFYKPQKLVGLDDVIAITAGNDHSLALRVDGTVWAWGANNFGQLGDGTTTDKPAPVQVKVLKNVIAISAGSGFSLALQANGKVRAWGYNGNGQLGDGTTRERHRPVVVTALDDVAVISACGLGNHALALKADGMVWAWGQNNYGQLGLGTTQDYLRAEQVIDLPPAIGIAAGGWHSLALAENGSVWVAGRSDSGQIGSGATVGPPEDHFIDIGLVGVVEVAAGNAHSLARFATGAVYAWGSGNAGRLGTGGEADRYRPTPVLEATDAVDDPLNVGAPVGHMIAIAAGGMHSLMIRDEQIVKGQLRGSSVVWAWGANQARQLTPGSILSYSAYAITYEQGPYGHGTAIAAGAQLSGLAEMGRIVVWGEHNAQTSWDPFEPGTVFTNLPLSAAFAFGPKHALLVDERGFCYEWDYLGVPHLVLDQGSPIRVSAVAVGGDHRLILRADGGVFAWGMNDRGQLGLGSPDDHMHPLGPVLYIDEIVAIAAGFAHSLALRADGTVWAWGANEFGQLGDKTTLDRAWPGRVVQNARGLYLHAKAIAAYGGGHHSLALAADGTVRGWGWNERGQVGDGSVTLGDFRTWAVRTRWAAPFEPLTRVKAIAAGWQHSLALLANGRTFGWGLNAAGQLGEGSTNLRYGPDIGAPVQWTFPLDETGAQRILPLDGVTALGAGDRHSLALGGQPSA
jgi:alpha-tubulin suppressor-like RCC1 family protein